MVISVNSDPHRVTPVPPPYLAASDISKSFEDTVVLRDIDLSIEQGETVCLLGSSGCGKTTLLRIIAGLEQPDRGRIILQGEDITALPAHRRDFGLMFQDYALFPHLSVADNIAFGLRMRGWPGARIEARVAELLEMVELAGYGERKVYELSGGQQQRVALARSLAPEPRLLMLDEPLGSLDRTLRDQLLSELRQLLQQLRQTALYVTHDQLEAFALADRIVLMHKGRIEQQASPTELYLRPASPFAARFLGFKNFLSGEITALEPAPRITTTLGVLQPISLSPAMAIGDTVSLVIRPEGANVVAGLGSGVNHLRLSLLLRSFRGAHTLLRLKSSDPSLPEFEFELSGLIAGMDFGAEVTLEIDPASIVVFDRR